MSHDLSFERLFSYDPGEPGISIMVEIRIGQEFSVVEAKIDTGATYCIFQRSVGENLGIDIESGEPKAVKTVNGIFQVFGHGATLITEGFEFDSPIYFAADGTFRRNILGRHGWLDRMIIAVNDYDCKLYLSRYND